MNVEVPLSEPMLALLAAARLVAPPESTVANALNGKEIKRQAWQKRWLDWKTLTGVRSEVQPHDLRRALARSMYAASGDVRQVQTLLGHSSLWATFHYLGNAVTGPIDGVALDAARRGMTNER
jgi:site-specific recombinase XerC